jgi:hypothetical protein
MEQKTHMGMKVLGILAVIGGILAIIGGVLFSQLGAMMTEEAGEAEGLEGILTLIPLISVGTTLTAIALPMIIVGLFMVFFGIFVYQEKRWAYVLLLVFGILGLIVSIIGFSIWGIFICGVIVLYCWMIREDFIGSNKGSKADYKEV